MEKSTQNFDLTGKNYYPQVFLEECKKVIKGKKFVSISLMI